MNKLKKTWNKRKSDLATLTADAKAKADLVATKSQEATKASQNLKALQAKVAELATAIKNAEEKRDKSNDLERSSISLGNNLEASRN